MTLIYAALPFLLPLLQQEPAAAPAAAAPPATLALLVGINVYAPTIPEVEVPPLKGPANDVARARKVLEQRFGFAPDSIVTLVGPAATHEAIVRTFHTHLIQQAGPHTRVVFWFSGHGSRAPDATQRDTSPRGSSEIAFDSTLVAFDSRAVDPLGGYDVSDDELHSLLRALPTEDVLVVTDCCHAGGVLRSARRPGTRDCPPGTAPVTRRKLPFWPGSVPFLDDDTADLPAQLRHVVHVAACGAEQEAGEKTTPSGTFGTLTWYLGQALLTCEPGTTWGAIGARTRAWVQGDGDEPSQLVEVVGATGRSVLGGTATPLPPGYAVDRYGVRGLVVGAGRLQGLAVDTELLVSDLTGKEIGKARVVGVSASTADAEWNSPGTPPDRPLLALPRAPGPTTGPLSIRLGKGVEADLLAGCVAAVPARGAIADCGIEKLEATYRLVDGAGTTIRRLPADRTGLHTEMFREQAFRRLWNGIADPGLFALRVEALPAGPADGAEHRIVAAPLRHSGGATIVAAAPIDPSARTGGALVRIRVHNDSDEDLHVAVVSVAEDRWVRVVYGRDANNVVRAHGHDEVLVWIGARPGWPAGRPLVDRYVAVATARFTDFLPFESDAEPGALRGEQEGNPWGIASCDLQVVSPEAFAAGAKTATPSDKR